MTLLTETLYYIEKLEQSPDNITFIGSADGKYECTWLEFETLADFNYDSGFGTQEVPCDLVIVFENNTMLERYEYDGAERWRFCVIPKAKPNPSKIKSLNGTEIGWVDIAELN